METARQSRDQIDAVVQDQRRQLESMEESLKANREVIERLEQQSVGRESLEAECIQFKEESNSRQIQIDSLTNQIKVFIK